MTALELITQALVKTGLCEAAAIPTPLYNFAFNELNRIYSEVWAAYPFRDEKLLSVAVTSSSQDLIFPREVDVIRAMRNSTDPMAALSEVVLSNFSPSSFAEIGTAARFMQMPDSPVLAQPSSAQAVTFVSDSASDVTPIKVTVWGTESVKGVDASEQVTLTGTVAAVTTKSYTSIKAISKPATTGIVSIKYGSVVQGYMFPYDDRSAYRRVRLIPAPLVSTTYYLECLRRFTPLVYDSDSVLLKRTEAAIFRQLLADLYEYNDQADLAVPQRQMAQSRLKEALSREEEQEDTDTRSFPDYGNFSDDVYLMDTSKTGLGRM